MRKFPAMPSKFFSCTDWLGKGTYLVVVEPHDLQVGEVLELLDFVKLAVREMHLNAVSCVLCVLRGVNEGSRLP